jgi:hypothetical protein
MAQIPTASELIRLQFCEGEFDEIMDCLNGSIEPDITQAMIDFAKVHVEAALKEASENAKASLGKDWIRKEETIHPRQLVDTIIIKVDKDSILNSYPLTNIK